MSRAKLEEFKKEILIGILESQGKSKRWLAGKLKKEYSGFNKRVNAGKMQWEEIVAIAQILDVSPMVLTGEEGYSFSETTIKNDYSMYVRNLIDHRKFVKDLLLITGCSLNDYESLESKERWALIWFIQDACKVFMASRENGLNQDIELKESLKQFQKDVGPHLNLVKSKLYPKNN